LRLRRLPDPQAATSGRIPAAFGSIARVDLLGSPSRGIVPVQFL